MSGEVIEELRSLARNYASGVDRRDRELFLSAFHPDATLTVVRTVDGAPKPARPLVGHDGIGRIIESIAIYEQTFHFLGQSDYRISDVPASGEVSCIAHHRWTDPADPDHTELDHVMYIRYLDQYRAGGDGRWRIAARDVTVDWSETRVVDRPGKRPAR